jgi:ribosomal-protein-alanine N-acetyltransferase
MSARNPFIVTEASRAIIKYAFEQLDFHRIEGRCDINNIGSAKTMEKLGMRLEGVLREQLKIQGHFADQKMYAILLTDYLI